MMAPLEEAEPTGSVRPAAPDSPRHSALAPDSASCPLDSALPPLLAVPVRVVQRERVRRMPGLPQRINRWRVRGQRKLDC